MHDAVNRPSHYTSHPSGVEAIEIEEYLCFNVGNAIKYLFRAGLKGDVAEDMRKALWYLRREIQRMRTGGAFGTPCPPAARAAALRLLDHGDDGVLGKVLWALFGHAGDYITAVSLTRAAHIVESVVDADAGVPRKAVGA
jgi:hypothetical protein